MINLNIKKIVAKNFFCFGPEGIEIDFEKLGPIVHVTGENFDILKTNNKNSRNGIGKSTICDIISYALYGKTVKHPKKIKVDDVIHNKIGKKAYLEIIIDTLRVIRTRKPNSLRVWESEEGIWDDTTEKTKGTSSDTQDFIQNKLKISFETFCNLIIFTDNNRNSFLETDLAGKRQIIDNLLSLEDFKEYHSKSKLLKTKLSNEIKLLSYNYEQCVHEVESCKRQIEEIINQERKWKDAKRNEIHKLINEIKEKQKELGNSDLGPAIEEYNKAQERIAELEETIETNAAIIKRANPIIETANKKLEELNSRKNTIEAEKLQITSSVQHLQQIISQCKDTISSLQSKEGTKCPTCFGVVSKENYANVLLESENKIDACNSKVQGKLEELRKAIESYDSCEANILKIRSHLLTAESKRNNLNEVNDNARREITKLSQIEKPELSYNEKIIQERINLLKRSALDKKKELEEGSPYTSLEVAAKKDLRDGIEKRDKKKKEVEEKEKLHPYYVFWEKAFNSDGIPMYAIQGILPTLNSQISYWMQFLIDGKISVEFDNNLDEKITTCPDDGNPFVYAAMSGGEKRRLNLAIAAALSRVTMLSSGVQLNIMFLDEVSTNIDPQGIEGVYRMITEMSKERKIFVTSHDQGLIDLLSGCNVIYLEKRDGFSKVVNV